MPFSLLSAFDELVRCNTVASLNCETEFLQFTLNQEECQKQWMAAVIESQNLLKELEKANRNISVLEAKLNHAQHIIDKERQKRHEEELYVSKLKKLCHIEDSETNLSDETSSTDSLFPGLSYSLLEDGIDITLTHSGKPGKQQKPSTTVVYDSTNVKSKQHSDAEKTETSVSLEKANKINAVCGEDDRTMKFQNVEITVNAVNAMSNGTSSHPAPFCSKDNMKTKCQKNTLKAQLDVNIQDAVKNNSLSLQKTPHKKINTNMGGMFPLGLKKLNNRNHIFCFKSVIYPENCNYCGKRIMFGKMVTKCRDCRTSCHPECKAYIPIPCVPVGNNMSTLQGRVMGVISDYAPPTAPMVPSLIVHCVNEVDLRGLDEVGIYRIPGSEKDVRELKEKFLRCKGVPNLSQTDIHAICGAIKDFLRSLREPLVTNFLWEDFVKAPESQDADDCKALMYQAISKLPQPNRDTLAFLIMHLQRVAECPGCKMPVFNLARIFGPTIVGYTVVTSEPIAMLMETKKQAAVVEHLMGISCDYWANFLNVDS